jgi:hypothetical protein
MKRLFTLVAGLVLCTVVTAQVQHAPLENVIDLYTSSSKPRPSSVSYTMPYKFQENRYLLFIFTGEFNKDQDYPTAITYNGKPATLLGLSVGSDAEATDAKTAVAVFGIKDATLGAETAKGGTYDIEITWFNTGTVSNNQAYVLTVTCYRYVNQDDPGNFCINGSIGNDQDLLTCSPVTAGVGDLLWHITQFSRALQVNTSQPPVNTNSFMDVHYNALLPTGNLPAKAFVGTIWDQLVSDAMAAGDADGDPNTLTYTPTFNNASGTNPGRWVVATIRAKYAPIYQNYSGLVWIDKDGDKAMEPDVEFVPSAGAYVFVAVASNGPKTGKVVAASILDGDGKFSFSLLADQVEVGGLYVDPTYTLALVRSAAAPHTGEAYSTSPGNAMGSAPTSNTPYYVTTTGSTYIMGSSGVATNVTVSVPVQNKYYEIGIQSPPFATDVNGGSGFKKGQGFVQMTSMGAGSLLGVDAENGTLSDGRTFNILSLPIQTNPDQLKPLVLHLAYDLNGDMIMQANEIIDGNEDLPFKINNYDPDRMYLKYVSGDGTFNGFFEYTAVDEALAESPTPGQVTFSIILPATAIQLKGAVSQGSVLLKWQLVGDEPGAVLRIERSLDGSTFTGIGQATLGANANEYMDNLANFTGLEAFYRIAMAKANGAILYSNTWSVALPVVAEFQVAPTLVNNNCIVRLNNRKAQAIQIRIVNANGQVVMNYAAQTVAGIQTLPVTGFEKLAPGSYHIQIVGGNAMVQKRIMVMH